MGMTRGENGKPDSDLAVVKREYATEAHFLARRLTATAELHGPLIEDAVIAAIADRSPRTLLDVGCGTGDLTERIRDAVCIAVTGLDISPRMVELTSARGIPAQQGDIQSLPFPADKFDCVLANRVLYHVPDLDQGLAEIARVLRPGGFLVAVTYSDDHLRELWDLLPPSAHPPLGFSAQNGAATLRRQFNYIEHRDLSGVARFASRHALQAYFDSYGEFAAFSTTDVELVLEDVSVPFDATYRHSLFIATTNRSHDSVRSGSAQHEQDVPRVVKSKC